MTGHGLPEALHSARNRVFWELRSRLKWSRSGYRESGAEDISGGDEALLSYKPYLSSATYRKNEWTLALLRRFLAPHLRAGVAPAEILEPGCQDFARLPAMHAFFRDRVRITGLELDAYPVLHDFHSRADKANYYLKAVPSVHRYLAVDFFRWQEPADLITCFYPFVSAHPALAWGLPARFGNPKPWVNAFARNLRPGGLLLVVHQGEWEEKDFDAARLLQPLRLLERGTFATKHYPLPHPACVSVYRRGEA
jgi:hypothetical protein